MGRRAGFIGGGSLAVLIATLGWPIAALGTGLCVLILALIAWILDSPDRSSSLATVLLALRGIGKRE